MDDGKKNVASTAPDGKKEQIQIHHKNHGVFCLNNSKCGME